MMGIADLFRRTTRDELQLLRELIVDIERFRKRDLAVLHDALERNEDPHGHVIRRRKGLLHHLRELEAGLRRLTELEQEGEWNAELAEALEARCVRIHHALRALRGDPRLHRFAADLDHEIVRAKVMVQRHQRRSR